MLRARLMVSAGAVWIRLALLSALASGAAAPLAAQSELECQDASKLHAEQDLIQQLFNTLWEQTKRDGAPARGDTSRERAENRSLQTRVRDGISDCQSNGGGTEACGNYYRIRNAWLANHAPGAPDAAMATDPQTCKIIDPDTHQEITAADRPDGYAGVVWYSQFHHEQYHQLRCREANGPNGGYEPGGAPSPYSRRLDDPRLLAEEEVIAHAITQGVLEDYLRKNCYDPKLEVDAEDMKGTCGESVEGDLTLRSAYATAKSWVATTLSNIVSLAATGPVETPANGENQVGMNGSCICCDGTTKTGKVRVYGGPGHSILVGDDDANIGCASGNKCAGMSGDPHMRSYDGLRFDFQGAGEFVLSKGEHFEVQARMQPFAYLRTISLGMAVAVRLHGDVVSLYAGRPPRLVVKGAPTALEVGGGVRLPGGALVMRPERFYRITTPEGFVLEVSPYGSHLNLRLGLPRTWRSVGLLGDLDENHDNDLRTATGRVLTHPADFETLYKVFGAGWRVTPETSLFEYAEGESADSFWDPDFPDRPQRAGELDAEARRKAEAICRKAGVTDPINLEDCILDVAVTGDEGFAEQAAGQPAGDSRLEMEQNGPSPDEAAPAPSGAITFHMPEEGIAAHDVEIRIEPMPRRGAWIGFAPVGSDPLEHAANPYSALGSNGDRDVITLVVPTIPGDYELRYREQIDGEHRILARRPFRSIEPRVRLEAPPAAPAGGDVAVRVIGDVGEHMKLKLVRAGTDDVMRAAEAALTEGSEDNVVVRILPSEPGEYKIVCISNWEARIYARRPLTIR